jgi:hypothetical protein
MPKQLGLRLKFLKASILKQMKVVFLVSKLFAVTGVSFKTVAADVRL